MARKKKELILHEGHPWDKENSPWGQEADYYSQKTGEPFSKCRDIIITDYLQNGDPRPLAAIFMMGEPPGPDKQATVKEKFQDLIQVSFGIDEAGSKIVVYEPEGLENR